MAEGVKHDGGKLRWSLLPTGTVRSIVKVLEIGANKYSVDNWKRVPEARTRYYDAMMRHTDAWWNGEKLDPEDGLHHLAHAGCCLLFLLWFDENNTAVLATEDDNPAGFFDDGYGPWVRITTASAALPSSAYVQMRDADGFHLRQGAVHDLSWTGVAAYRVRKEAT